MSNIKLSWEGRENYKYNVIKSPTSTNIFYLPKPIVSDLSVTEYYDTDVGDTQKYYYRIVSYDINNPVNIFISEEIILYSGDIFVFNNIYPNQSIKLENGNLTKSGNSVTGWNDSSGYNRHLKQDKLNGSLPTEGAINGFRTTYFSNYKSLSTEYYTNIIKDKKYISFVYVFSCSNSATGLISLFSFKDSSSNNYLYCGINNRKLFFGIRPNTSSTYKSYSSTKSTSNTSNIILIEYSYETGYVKGWLNGELVMNIYTEYENTYFNTNTNTLLQFGYASASDSWHHGLDFICNTSDTSLLNDDKLVEKIFAEYALKYKMQSILPISNLYRNDKNFIFYKKIYRTTIKRINNTIKLTWDSDYINENINYNIYKSYDEPLDINNLPDEAIATNLTSLEYIDTNYEFGESVNYLIVANINGTNFYSDNIRYKYENIKTYADSVSFISQEVTSLAWNTALAIDVTIPPYKTNDIILLAVDIGNTDDDLIYKGYIQLINPYSTLYTKFYYKIADKTTLSTTIETINLSGNYGGPITAIILRPSSNISSVTGIDADFGDSSFKYNSGSSHTTENVNNIIGEAGYSIHTWKFNGYYTNTYTRAYSISSGFTEIASRAYPVQQTDKPMTTFIFGKAIIKSDTSSGVCTFTSSEIPTDNDIHRVSIIVHAYEN